MLAASYTHHSRTAFAEDITRQIEAFLTREISVPSEEFREYLFNKPGSPRYTRLRRAIRSGEQDLIVEQQDHLLSDKRLSSSVGALTQDYFDNALGLAHMLKLVKKDQNLLLTRGRLSLSSGWKSDDPFHIGLCDALYLGMWLFEIDYDWIWAFLSQFPADLDFEVSVENRVELLLDSWRHLLVVRKIGAHPDAKIVRTRLNDLIEITERNNREKLNFGQPWSWFLVPRLELLVDAGVLRKKSRFGLSGYTLTATGQKMRSLCLKNEGGKCLIDHYFACHDKQSCSVVKGIEWGAIQKKLDSIPSTTTTIVGYLPIFEVAGALCVAQFLEATKSGCPLWEIEGIKEALRLESQAPNSNVRLGIDRRGRPHAFRLLN